MRTFFVDFDIPIHSQCPNGNSQVANDFLVEGLGAGGRLLAVLFLAILAGGLFGRRFDRWESGSSFFRLLSANKEGSGFSQVAVNRD